MWRASRSTDLRKGQAGAWLAALHDNAIGVVDGETPDDYRVFADAVLKAAAAGKRLLFRSAASLLTALAKLPPQPVAAESFATLVRDGQPGAVVVGSHVAKTTAQLTALLKERGVVGLPLDVARLPAERARRGRRTDRQHRPRACAGPHPGGVHQPQRAAVRQRGGAAGLRRGGVGHA